MKKVLIVLSFIIALAAFAIWMPDADAYKLWSTSIGATGNCASCHQGFRETANYSSLKDGGALWGNSLHNVHLNLIMNGIYSCNDCHYGAGTTGRAVNLSSSSTAADGVNKIACSGCHGRLEDANTVNSSGTGWGAGLRQHHWKAGQTICANCHADANPANFTPAGENTMPAWYGFFGLDSCNAINRGEDFAGSIIGLDNDGDDAYDSADSDCSGCIPTGLPDNNCDGIDDDCDGTPDDNYVAPQTFCGVGVCANTGLLECQNGQLVDTCVALPKNEPTDVTCDGRDGDCDGSIDEDFAPQPTTCGVGECASTGTLSCQNGSMVNSCVAGSPTAEVCDGKDNNCNGQTDDGIASTPTTCGVGECASTGTLSCIGGSMVNSCVAGTPTTEVCDGKDNNCNGQTDDGIASTPTTCGVGECASTGTLSCIGGSMVNSCVAGTPQTEGPPGDATCSDGKDNDCDGLTDYPADLGCVQICVPTTEVCDGVDNDCDNQIDEGIASTPTTCGVGQCASTGTLSCVGGSMVDSCVAGSPTTEVCDGIDNDCDNQIDEGIASTPTTCGVGECASTGTLSCIGGSMVNSCVAGSPQTEGPPGDATCSDGKDNDCDGLTDGPADPGCVQASDYYIITASAGANGGISPSGSVSVASGGSQSFTLTPDAGYRVANVIVDGVSMGSITRYNFINITANHTISASFTLDEYAITASIIIGSGTITPAGVTMVSKGGSQAYTITADLGYYVAWVVIDGVDKGALTSYTFSNVTADHTIKAYLKLITYTITASAGADGSISPSGSVSVVGGSDQSFAITPNAGYYIADVLIDGSSAGAVTSYTFTNVTAAHTISATFTANPSYTITATAGSNGSISPAGNITVTEGTNLTCIITPDAGYRVANVIVDGASMGSITRYNFINITANHTISASFTLDEYSIDASTIGSGTITPAGVTMVSKGGSQTYTITADPGYYVARVVVDGANKGALTTYTFTNVTLNHKIKAYFKFVP